MEIYSTHDTMSSLWNSENITRHSYGRETRPHSLVEIECLDIGTFYQVLFPLNTEQMYASLQPQGAPKQRVVIRVTI